MRTTDIIEKIHNDFADTYKSASKFVNSGELWDFCIDTIKNPVALGNIVFANDMGVPPVKSLITIYERKINPSENFSAVQSQYMGALMGFVFKFVLAYTNQSERCTVNKLGVKTATKFLDGPIWEFEE
jgi:hypothetical protein